MKMIKLKPPRLKHTVLFAIILVGVKLLYTYITTDTLMKNHPLPYEDGGFNSGKQPHVSNSHMCQTATCVKQPHVSKMWIIVQIHNQESLDKFVKSSCHHDHHFAVAMVTESSITSSLTVGSVCKILGNTDLKPYVGLLTADAPKRLLAYLYAIKHGAEKILDLHHVSSNVSAVLDGFVLEPVFTGLVDISNEPVVNVYRHFGQPYVLPYGIKSNGNSNQYNLCEMECPSIQYSLLGKGKITGQIIGEKRYRNLLIEFDENAPRVVLSRGTISHVSSGAILYNRNSFWALFIPASHQTVSSYAIRDFVAQSLIQYIRGYSCYHVNSITSYDDIDKLSLPIGEESEHLFDILKVVSTFKCKEAINICLINLYEQLEKMKLLNTSSALKIWLAALMKVDYSFQSVKVNHPKPICDGKEMTKVTFHPNYKPIPGQAISDANVKRNNVLNSLFTLTCNGITKSPINSNFNTPWTNFDILLVVSFNWPKYKDIPYLEAMYRGVFKNIVYCGTGSPSAKELNGLNITFISYDLRGGRLAYGCVIMAIEMGYKVNGYFHISDDVAVSPWIIQKYPRGRIWYNGGAYPGPDILWDAKLGVMCRAKPKYKCDLKKKIRWIHYPGNRDALIKTYQLIHSGQLNRSDVQLCSDNLKKTASGNTTGWYYDTGDLYYIPRHLAHSFAYIASLFLQENVYLEITSPAVLLCLRDPDNKEATQLLNGRHFWGSYGNLYEKLSFLDKHDYFHTAKLSGIIDQKEKDTIKYFCGFVSKTYNSSLLKI